MNREQKRTLGKASAWYKNGIHVLHLRGTGTEIAGQHGALLSEEIKQGALPYLGEKNFHLLSQSHLFRGRPLFAKAAEKFIHTVFHKPMLAQVPRHYIEEAQALARGAGIPYKYCEESMVQADTLVLMLRWFLGRYVLGQMAGGFPGCTSVVALGKATASGGVMHARNMDYPVVGKWDAFPTVFFCDPDHGQRYVGMTTAGVHTAGVSAVNESGLSVASHFHCSRTVSVFGTPIQFIASEVSRVATTIGQAVDIVKNFERAGSWGIVVTSAKENDAVVIEMVHGKLFVRGPENGLLAHSNHFRNPELQKNELLISAAVADDFLGRYHRALELVEESYGKIDRGVMARVLADHWDRETGRVRSQGNTISVVTTVTSFITELANGRFWVANSNESPVNHGDYSGFRIDETFEGFDTREPEIFSWSPKGATTIKGTEKEAAFKLFRKAYIAYHTEYDPERAADFAEQAAAADSEEGHFHMAHGHFRMRLGQVEKALDAFTRATKCVLTPHMAQVAALFTAHALDCTGRRDEAVTRYRDVFATAIDPSVRDEARRCLKRPYHADRAMKMTFDLQYCDTLEYA